MKFIKYLISILMLILFVSCGKSSNKLVVGTTGDYFPYEYMENGKITGFEHELLEEIALRADLKLKWVISPFNTLVPSLEKGKFDLGIANFFITEERTKVLNFSEVILENKTIIVANKDKTSEYIPTGKVGFQLDTINENKALEVAQGEKKGFLSTEAAVKALSEGALDYVIMDIDAAKKYFYQYPNLHSVKEIAIDNSAIAISKKLDQEIVDKINLAIRNMKNDGTFDALRKKYNL